MGKNIAKSTSPHLTPDRRIQRDFFVADLLDVAPKGDMASMEHPLFALRAGDRRVRVYERQNVSVTVMPGSSGCATIHDKDLWIYCISQLVEARNRGREISQTVRFTMYDFLKTTNRTTSGVGYKNAVEMLRRLSGTRIETDIRIEGQRERRGFGLIDSWEVIERDDDERMIAVQVDLPRWLFWSIEAKKVLTLSPDYFRLRKPLDRRVYELARKHCGHQPTWKVSISTLHEKSGSTDKRFNFRAAMKQLTEADALPDYRMNFDAEADTLTFRQRENRTVRKGATA